MSLSIIFVANIKQKLSLGDNKIKTSLQYYKRNKGKFNNFDFTSGENNFGNKFQVEYLDYLMVKWTEFWIKKAV